MLSSRVVCPDKRPSRSREQTNYGYGLGGKNEVATGTEEVENRCVWYVSLD